MGLDVGAGAVLFILYSITLFLASIPAGVATDRLGRKAAQILADTACIIYLFLVAAAAWYAQWGLMIAAFITYGIFEALWMASRRAVIAELAPVEARAQVLGTFSMLYGISLMVSPFLFGLVWTLVSVQVACVVAAAICTASGAFLAIYARETLSGP